MKIYVNTERGERVNAEFSLKAARKFDREILDGKGGIERHWILDSYRETARRLLGNLGGYAIRIEYLKEEDL